MVIMVMLFCSVAPYVVSEATVRWIVGDGGKELGTQQ
jgi:hypothetical protein